MKFLKNFFDVEIKLYIPFQDTLACLASDEIKLASLKTRHDDIGEMDGAPDVEGAVASAVKKAIISQVSSNNRIKFIIIWQINFNFPYI